MTIEPPLTAAHLQRLQTWFGPSFPVGAFSYSHGLEAAFEAGLVTDRESLMDWLEGLLLFGSARNDAILFAEAYRRFPDVAEVRDLATALSPSKELRAETLNQGEAFLRAVRQGWPALAAGNEEKEEIALPAAAGACCAAAAIPLKPALTAYLHAFTANIVSAALRCIPLGQSDGLAVQATLEPLVETAADNALAASLDDIGSAAPMLDWLSATHETQYSRLFRS
jgi:urease accessory protein